MKKEIEVIEIISSDNALENIKNNKRSRANANKVQKVQKEEKTNVKQKKMKSNDVEQTPTKKFKPIQTSTIIRNKSVRELVSYLKSLDLSNLDENGVDIIMNEIRGKETQIILCDGLITKFKMIFKNATVDHCLTFLDSIDIEKVLYKNLGAKVLENILNQMFLLLFVDDYTKTQYEKDEILDRIHNKFKLKYIDMLLDQQASYVFRHLLGLYTGKLEKDRDFITYDHPNVKFIKEVKRELDCFVFEEYRIHVFISLANYVTITKSQKFMKRAVEYFVGSVKTQEDFEGFFKNKEWFYEKVILLCNTEINQMFSKKAMEFDVVKLSEIDEMDYFVQKYLRKTEIYVKIEKMDELSENIWLSYMIHLLKHDKQNILEEELVRRNITSIFKHYALIDGTLNTKYVDLIVVLWEKFYDLNVCSTNKIAVDFVDAFQKAWINTKAGKTLLEIFAAGVIDRNIVSHFFDENVDLFFTVKQWNNFEKFLRNALNVCSGHTKKKVGDILRHINKEE